MKLTRHLLLGRKVMTNLDGIFKSRDITLPTKVHLVSFNSVQLLSRVRLFATPWTAVCQASLSITNSQSLPKLIPIESVMPSNHFILCHPLLSHLQSFPASGSFQMSQFFASGGQSIGVSASASVFPMNKAMVFLVVMYGCESWTIKKAEQ